MLKPPTVQCQNQLSLYMTLSYVSTAPLHNMLLPPVHCTHFPTKYPVYTLSPLTRPSHQDKHMLEDKEYAEYMNTRVHTTGPSHQDKHLFDDKEYARVQYTKVHTT